MCGRFLLDTTPDAIQKRFRTEPPIPMFRPLTQVLPGMMLPVIIAKESKRQGMLMRWGFIPSWAKDPKIGYKMINARAETIQEKPTFRSSFLTKRCLIPTTGFYEWKHEEVNRKTPYIFRLPHTPLFAFAGLYDEWKDAEGVPLSTFTIITTTPNAVVAPVHDRMPVILPSKHEEIWLHTDASKASILLPLLKSYPDDDMEASEAKKSSDIQKQQSLFS